MFDHFGILALKGLKEFGRLATCRKVMKKRKLRYSVESEEIKVLLIRDLKAKLGGLLDLDYGIHYWGILSPLGMRFT